MHPSSDNYSLNYIDYSYNSPISPSSSLYHIASPPLHYYEDELLLLQALIRQHQQSQPLDEESNNLDTISAVGLVQNESFASGVVQNNRRLDNSIHYKNEGQVAITNNNNNNKRASKKDRHSKITTARGARDRRMRLSLDVAREFFDLQDTLGFDKASKTVDWLLTKSSSAIREAAASLGFIINSASPSASECDDDARTKPQGGSTSTVLQEKGKKKKAKQARIIRAPFHALTKESRKKARERARERTMLKKQLGEESGTYQQNKAGILFSQQLPVMVDTRVNKKISGTNQQYNAGIFSKQVEELEQELLSSDLSCIFK